MRGYSRWSPYVSVAERRAKAQRKVQQLKKKGVTCQPIEIEGRIIARTFWGKKWCEHIEQYSDYANRLPRGRTYARNGSVVDLHIEAGKIRAMVAGSDIYSVHIEIKPLPKECWQVLMVECAGKVGSLIELLQGRISQEVMQSVARPDTGLFPLVKEMNFRCACPDWAGICKHMAAVLYGVGHRLDSQPELLFLLRGVDPQQLIMQAGAGIRVETTADAPLLGEDLSALFGIELSDSSPAIPSVQPIATSKMSTKNQVKKAEPKRIKPSTGDKISARELLEMGIPRHQHYYWLKTGVLMHTKQRGIYYTTKRALSLMQSYLQAKV